MRKLFWELRFHVSGSQYRTAVEQILRRSEIPTSVVFDRIGSAATSCVKETGFQIERTLERCFLAHRTGKRKMVCSYKQHQASAACDCIPVSVTSKLIHEDHLLPQLILPTKIRRGAAQGLRSPI